MIVIEYLRNKKVPNFNISMVFSHREICEPYLIEKTKKAIAEQLSNFMSGTILKKKVQFYFDSLKDEIRKCAHPTDEEEIKLARLLVQAAHPSVIELLILDRAEIFLSYSHEIADLLDVQTWQALGSKRGMQSFKGQEKRIFISCGGNPLKANKYHAEYGDGQLAIARILIIGVQEIAHYSDIKRDEETGRAIFDRYSADINLRLAKPDVKIARIKDMKRTDAILKQFVDIGLQPLLKIEKVIKFHRKDNRNYVFFMELLKLYIKRMIFKHKAKKLGLYKILQQIRDKQYQATMLKKIILDMQFNLAPKADSYANKNKDIEEAIACAEALARVPQQENKWGVYMTKTFMQELHEIYYTEVIPKCIKAYENLSKKKFTLNNKKIGRSFFEKVKALLKRDYREIDFLNNFWKIIS